MSRPFTDDDGPAALSAAARPISHSAVEIPAFVVDVRAMSAHDSILSLPNGPVRVHIHGESGPALFWTHGMFHPIDVDDRSPLGPVFEHIPGWRVIRYDTRGQGRTPPAHTVEAHHWDALGAELIQLADALGVDRFVAGGISMGAAVSLHAALLAPERFACLVLLAPPTAWETRPSAIESYSHLASLDGPVEVARQVELDLIGDFGGRPIPSALRFMVDQLALADRVALGRVLRAAAQSDLPPRERLAEFDIATLLLPWVDDPGHPVETALALQQCLRDSVLVTLEGVADTELIERSIAEFLGRFERQLAEE
jgi:pimeloyl-ACP methyl ester carboxylesterase